MLTKSEVIFVTTGCIAIATVSFASGQKYPDVPVWLYAAIITTGYIILGVIFYFMGKVFK